MSLVVLSTAEDDSLLNAPSVYRGPNYGVGESLPAIVVVVMPCRAWLPFSFSAISASQCR